jgi:hypothetical protein
MDSVKRLHQTTIRFAPDVWREIEEAAGAGGVSAAHFIRDAAVTRLAHLATRGLVDLGEAFEIPVDTEDVPREIDAGPPGARADAARAGAEAALEDSQAVWAQARLARLHARTAREEAERLRSERRGGSVV